jgi:hypothetical protein
MSQLVIDANDAFVAETEADTVSLSCECGHPDCADFVLITRAEHTDARSRHARLLSTRHAAADGGRVIAAFDRYVLTVDA